MTRPALKSKKLVRIDWDDSSTPVSGGWQDIDDLDHTPIKCISVGYVMKRNKKVITLAAHIGGEDPIHCVTGLMTIPTKAITSIVELKPGKKS